MADLHGIDNSEGYRPVEGASPPNSMDPGNYSPTEGEKLNMSVKDIGMSVPMGISAANVSGIYSKIRMGAGSIEIGFPGAVYIFKLGLYTLL